MTVFKKTVATFVTLGVLVPALAFAQTSTPSIQALLEQIRALQTQMASLVQQQQTLAQQQQGLAQQQNTAMVSLLRTLSQGASGDDVRALQALLAADSDVYPDGTISGYYGRLTAEAVKRFQKKHGIKQAGNVGPKTLRKLNEFLRDHPLGWQVGTSSATSTREGRIEHGVGNRPCAIVPPGHLIAPGWLRKHRDDDDKPVVPPCQTIPGGIWDKLVGTSTRDRVRDRDRDRSDTVAPVISAVSVAPIATTTATISWTTNEAATGKVYYSAVSPVNLGSALTMSSVLYTTPHTFGLTGLTASTTYYYVLESKDASNNTATTSGASFVTTP